MKKLFFFLGGAIFGIEPRVSLMLNMCVLLTMSPTPPNIFKSLGTTEGQK
jgi:hypothetical protein